MHEIRLMTLDDVSAVLRIQAECYLPAMVENAETIRARLLASPDSAWVVEDGEGVSAYLVAYRSILGKVTPLGDGFDIPAAASSLYLHDLAVSSRARGSGAGVALVQRACGMAKGEGLAYSSLVSVQGSKTFWTSQGYCVMDNLEPAQRGNLATYAVPNCYMTKRLG